MLGYFLRQLNYRNNARMNYLFPVFLTIKYHSCESPEESAAIINIDDLFLFRGLLSGLKKDVF